MFLTLGRLTPEAIRRTVGRASERADHSGGTVADFRGLPFYPIERPTADSKGIPCQFNCLLRVYGSLVVVSTRVRPTQDVGRNPAGKGEAATQAPDNLPVLPLRGALFNQCAQAFLRVLEFSELVEKHLHRITDTLA